MKETKKIKKEVEETTDIICDWCDKSCKVYPMKDKTIFLFEYMTLLVTWGYGSSKDMERWEAQICEKCVDEKFKKIKFSKEEYDVFNLNSTRKVKQYDKPAKLNT